MTMSSDDAAGVVCSLPPHGPANMMSLYMTRYDYDYNRDPTLMDSKGVFEKGMSGDVRNRPIFAYGTDKGERDDRTIYQVDYTPKDRSVKDMAALAATLNGGPPEKNSSDVDNSTAYQRNWYRPGVSSHIVLADGSHPHTTYQDDYQARARVPGGSVDNPVCYAGAAARAYNADLLRPNGMEGKGDDDDDADIAPKITSKESLLPKKHKTANGAYAPVFDNIDQYHTWNDCVPGDGVIGEYTCTSWDYGDTSDAHPLQLPVSLERSLAAHDPDLTANPDKAALLRQLAGKYYLPTTHRGTAGGAATLDTNDRTNPQFLSRIEQRHCAVSQRLEKEHYVTMSIYKSDFIDQGLLPELPGNPGGPANARDTCTNPLTTAGEMMAGQLTNSTRQLGLLRNAHGTLKSGEAHPASKVSTGILSVMRTLEKAASVDKADPHRHKLRP